MLINRALLYATEKACPIASMYTVAKQTNKETTKKKNPQHLGNQLNIMENR